MICGIDNYISLAGGINMQFFSKKTSQEKKIDCPKKCMAQS